MDDDYMPERERMEREDLELEEYRDDLYELWNEAENEEEEYWDESIVDLYDQLTYIVEHAE